MHPSYWAGLLASFFLPIHLVLGQTPIKKPFHIETLTRGHNASFRGLSVVNDSVLWVSGTSGTVGYSEDGGKQWKWIHIKGAEQLDFRSIVAFNSQKVVIVSAGTPATIYRTTDQGAHWKKVYGNKDDRFFLDGLVFWDQYNGLVYGDPIGGHFVILHTKDGGRHWERLPSAQSPAGQPGEVSFAASGTAIFALPPSSVWIGTGGKTARVHFSHDYGHSWQVAATPMIQGKASQGIFSLAFLNKGEGICVGGDYLVDSIRQNTAFQTSDSGKTWLRPKGFPGGYRSSVIYLDSQRLIATGKSGTDFSQDGGKSWYPLSNTGFYVVQKARAGSAVFLAGNQGRVARIKGYPQDTQSAEDLSQRERE